MKSNLKPGGNEITEELIDAFKKNTEENFNAMADGDGTYGDGYRTGSVYFDAYEGDEYRDEMIEKANQEIEEMTLVTQEG